MLTARSLFRLCLSTQRPAQPDQHPPNFDRRGRQLLMIRLADDAAIVSSLQMILDLGDGADGDRDIVREIRIGAPPTSFGNCGGHRVAARSSCFASAGFFRAKRFATFSARSES